MRLYDKWRARSASALSLGSIIRSGEHTNMTWHQLIIVLRAVIIILGGNLNVCKHHTRRWPLKDTHYFMNDGAGWENKQVERTKREKECVVHGPTA